MNSRTKKDKNFSDCIKYSVLLLRDSQVFLRRWKVFQ